MNSSGILNDRYIRNYNSLTLKDQDLLLKSRVCVVGLGGLGGCVMEMLTRTGIGSLTGIDNDKFDSSNLNRQIFCQENSIGNSKANVALNRLASINSQISLNCLDVCLTKTNAYNLIKNFDIVIDCLDSIITRFVLQDAAKKASIPLVSGAIAGASGQVTVIFPEDKGFELIYGKKKEELTHGVENEIGSLSFGAFLISSIQVSETIKILLNKNDLLRNKLLIADLWSNTFDVIDLT
jgi:molybdopterin-synthase adenylyltransferase